MSNYILHVDVITYPSTNANAGLANLFVKGPMASVAPFTNMDLL